MFLTLLQSAADDSQSATSVTSYIETDGGETQSSTSVSAYMETVGGEYSSATSVSAYIEFSGGNRLLATSVTAYAEVAGGDVSSATSVTGYVEIAPPETDPSGSTYISATSVTAYAESADAPADILVSKVVALYGTQDEGASVSQLAAYVEYDTDGLYVTHFGVLVEVDEEDSNIVPTYFTRKTAGPQSLSRLPEEVVGYALDPGHSFWQIVVPEETINLIENPSFETGTTGYSAEVANWTRVEHASVGSISGKYVLRRAYTGSTVSLYYTGILVAPGKYTFSAWIYMPSEFEVTMRIYDTVSAKNIAIGSFSPEYGGWHRYSVTGVSATGTPTVRCYMEFGSNQQDTYIYTDAWQLEAKGYATTYADGDMVGFYEDHSDAVYRWADTPHDSQSIRSGTTRSGGKIVNLSDDIGFLTTNIIGLGMSPVELDTVEMADGSEIYRGAFIRSRQFTITGRLYGNSYDELAARREALIDAVKPDVTSDNQPLTILYAPTDKLGDEMVAPVSIQAAYRDGLQGNVSNWFTESIPLQFYATVPQLKSSVWQSANIVPRQEFDNTGIWAYDVGSVNSLNSTEIERGWIDFGGGVTDNYVRDADWHPDGRLLACGDFTQICGEAINYVAEWNPLTQSWSDLDVTSCNGSVSRIAYGRGPSVNKVMIYGTFTTVNGNTCRGVAIYDRNTSLWTEPDNGIDNGSAVYGAIVAMPDGDFYIVGQFEQDGPGIQDFGRIVKYDTSADLWVPISSGSGQYGVNGVVYDATLGADGKLYFCGGFTDTAGSGGTSEYVGRLNPYEDSGSPWESLGDGIPITTGFPTARSITASPNGDVYVTTNVAPDTIWRWNGASWIKHYQQYTFVFFYIMDIECDSNGDLHVVGVIQRDTSFNKLQYDNNYFILSGNVALNGGLAQESFVSVTSTPTVPYPQRVVADPFGRVAICYVDNYSESDEWQAREITTVTNNGTGTSYPIIKVTGPGRVRSIRNHTVGADIQFEDKFDLQEDETLVIDLTGVRPKMYSNIRERVSENLLTGASNLRKWRLLPGENEIEALILDATEDTKVWLEWPITHWSIDASNT